MADQPWLDRVREQLARQALPSAYIQRLMEELSDHLEDLKEEGMEADVYSQLGDPQQVAEVAVVAYRRRSFLGRHPTAAFLAFAISPMMPQFVLMFLGVMALVTVNGYRTFDWYEHHWMLSLIVFVCSTFVSVVYGELAMRVGIGRKWMLVSCTVLGVNAVFWEFGIGSYAVTVMLLAQFAAPFAVGWWFAKQQHNHSYPATTFLVFAISPVASYMLLWLIGVSVIATGQSFVNGHSGLTDLLMYFVPAVVPSLLYCKLAKGFGSGRKWMFVSCMVLATFAAVQCFQIFRLAEYYTPEGQLRCSPIGLTLCISLVQFLVPLAIGWWFLRRNPDKDQLQLAA